MHGSIFVLLKRFVESKFDHSTWLKLLESSNISRHAYDMQSIYPDEEIYAIVGSASKFTGVEPEKLHEMFGEFLVPDLLLVYKKYIKPEWRTLDMIENTENNMHAAARADNAETAPPILHVTRKGPNSLVIDYYSKRRMGGLAVGIIKGIANYFHERDLIEVTPTTALDAERVQIKVEYHPPTITPAPTPEPEAAE